MNKLINPYDRGPIWGILGTSGASFMDKNRTHSEKWSGLVSRSDAISNLRIRIIKILMDFCPEFTDRGSDNLYFNVYMLTRI